MLKTSKWDAAEHLDTTEAIAAYIDAAIEDGDAALVVAALGDMARSTGMTEIARESGLSRDRFIGP